MFNGYTFNLWVIYYHSLCILVLAMTEIYNMGEHKTSDLNLIYVGKFYSGTKE